MANIVVNGTSGDDVLIVTATSQFGGSYSLNGGPAIDFTVITDSFTFNGFAGNDTFTINNPTGTLFAPLGGINFDGGGDIGDAINVFGGFAATRTLTLTSGSAGTLTHIQTGVTQTITFSNLFTTSLITSTSGSSSSSGNNVVRIDGSSGNETFNFTAGGLLNGVPSLQVGGPLNPDFRWIVPKQIFLNGGGGDDSVRFDYDAHASIIDLTGVGSVTQTVGITATGLALHDVTGPVTLIASNHVPSLAANLIGAGKAFSFNTAGGLTVLGINAATGLTTNNGDIAVTTEDGDIHVNQAVDAGTARATLTAGSAGSADHTLEVFLTVAGLGGVTLAADHIELTGNGTSTFPGTVNAGTATATLRPFQDGTLINLGGADGVNTLGITDGELDRITAGVIVVGSATAGRISFVDLVSPAHSAQLELVTGADVDDNDAFTDIAVARLGITAKTGIGLDNSINIEVGNFEATTETGGIFFLNEGLLTIGGVNDLLTGLRVTTSGSISGTSGDGIVLADSGGAETVFSASGDIFFGSSAGDVISTSTGHAVTAADGDITISTGRDILFGTGGAGSDNDVRASGDVRLTAARHIVIDGDADVVSGDFGSETGNVTLRANDGNVTIGTAAGTNASVGAAGSTGGTVEITAGATNGGHLFTNRGTVFSTSGRVTIRADQMDLQAGSSISAATEVNLRVGTGGVGGDLGSAAAGFNFTQSELDTITADQLRLTVAASLNVSQSITFDPARVQTLSLEATFGSITDGTATEATDLTVGSLAIRTALGIGSADDLDTAVSMLAFNNSNGGAVNISNAGALTIGAVDGLTTSFNAGTTNITASSPLTFAVTTTSAGTATYQAGETDDDPAGADDLTLDDFLVVSVTTGDLTLRAGDDVVIGVSTAKASGTVTVQAGYNDLDGIGDFVSHGFVQGGDVAITAVGDIETGSVIATALADLRATGGAISDNHTGSADITAAQLALRASTGIGTAADPLETDVDSLDATTATGGIFISNAGDLTIGGVDAALSGVQVTTSGDIDLTVTGKLTVDSDNIPAISTASGNITINADDIAVTAGDTISAGTGTLTIRPATAGRAIDLGNAENGTLGLTDPELDRMIAGTLVVGGDAAGALIVSAAISPANVANIFALHSGSTIAVNGVIDGGATAAVSLIAGGTITVTGNVTTVGGLSIETPAAATINGIVSGAGGLSQNGTGTTTVNGTQSYTGATTINAGTLKVAGDITASSGVSVTGGTLAGTGTTGAVTVNGGTLAPGASAGTLTVSGTLSFGLSGGTFVVEIGGEGALSDRVHVTGSGEVHLGNGVATLSATLIGGFNPEIFTGANIVIIDNDGTDAVTGTFAGLAEGAVLEIDGSGFRITYAGGTDNNDVVITAIDDPPQVAVALSDLVTQVNQPVSITIPAGTFTDPEGGPLTFTATLANGDPLPGTLSFDGTTITGKPPQNFVGDIEIAITADDSTSTVTDTFVLSVVNTGNDVLVSGGPGQTGTGDIFPLVGGTGDDVYAVADEVADITEEVGEGADTVYATVTYTLPENVEGLVLQEAGGAIDGTGSDNNDTIFGNSFTNWLTGGGGNDALIGGGGNDVLDGGAEIDGMAGGAGDDTYVVDNTGDQIQENAGEGADTVYAGASFTLPDNVEGLVLVEAAGAIDGTGSAGNDTIFGNSSNNVLDGGGGSDALIGGGGNDVLIGGAGVDGMAGGAGDDTYSVDSTFDDVQENAGEGADTVYAAATFTLTANVESLVLVEGAGGIDGTGNGDGNYIFGNGSDNTLHGAGGNDVLFGGAGADTLHGDGGDDVLVGGTDNDVFVFGAGFGHDTINDFAAGDQIAFSQAVFANFAAVQAHMVTIDPTTTAITLDGSNALAVHHAPGASLTQNDFLFV